MRLCLFLFFATTIVAGEKAPIFGGANPSLQQPVGYRFFRYELNSFLGIHVADEIAIISGTQFGLAPVKRVLFYVGPEVSFSFFSPGSLLEVLAAGWYEVRIYGAHRLSLNLGALLGVGIASQMPKCSAVCPITYAEVGISQEISEVATVTGRFRPGFVGGYYSFIMSLGVGFRFL